VVDLDRARRRGGAAQPPGPRGARPEAPGRPGGRELTRAILKASVVALLALLALWAFVSYLQPAFSGERAAEIPWCN
jgi:hypothetical protein